MQNVPTSTRCSKRFARWRRSVPGSGCWDRPRNQKTPYSLGSLAWTISAQRCISSGLGHSMVHRSSSSAKMCSKIVNPIFTVLETVAAVAPKSAPRDSCFIVVCNHIRVMLNTIRVLSSLGRPLLATGGYAAANISWRISNEAGSKPKWQIYAPCWRWSSSLWAGDAYGVVKESRRVMTGSTSTIPFFVSHVCHQEYHHKDNELFTRVKEDWSFVIHSKRRD